MQHSTLNIVFMKENKYDSFVSGDDICESVNWRDMVVCLLEKGNEWEVTHPDAGKVASGPRFTDEIEQI